MARASVATRPQAAHAARPAKTAASTSAENVAALRLVAKMVCVLGMGYGFMFMLPWYCLPLGVVMVGMAYTWLYYAGLDAGRSAFFDSKTANALLHEVTQVLRVGDDRNALVKALYLLFPVVTMCAAMATLNVDVLASLAYVAKFWLLPLAVMYVNTGIRNPKKSALENLFPEAADLLDSASKAIPFYKLDEVVKFVEAKKEQAAVKLSHGPFNPLQYCTREMLFWKKRDVVIFAATAITLAAVFLRGYTELFPEENAGALALLLLVPCLLATSSVNKFVEELDNARPADETREEETEEYWKDLPSLQELRAAIPKELFVRSTLRSLLHVAVDGAQIALVMYAGTFIPSIPNTFLRWVAWPLYWYSLGTVATGWWVLAHECGHAGFSPHRWVNHTVGLVLHTVLLVPYHPWRITHGLHHKYNMDMKRDQVFVPAEKPREELVRRQHEKKYQPQNSSPLMEAILESPIYGCIVMWAFGWPFYLLINIAGQDYGRWTSHFHWWSPVFKSSHKWQVIISDLALVAWFAVLYVIASHTSWMDLTLHYFMPYLFVNFWLVSITYLQHTDEHLPHFRGDAWDFVRGSVCTVDRDYGPLLNYLHHHIGDSHVAHHLFSTMPFYNAQKATPYLKKALGKYYREMQIDSVFLECFRSWRKCAYVPADGDIVCYRSA